MRFQEQKSISTKSQSEKCVQQKNASKRIAYQIQTQTCNLGFVANINFRGRFATSVWQVTF